MDNQHYRVSWEDLIKCHDEAIEFGGAVGVLNENSLRSALERPFNGYFIEIHWKAAALVHSIVINHGFVDGNKRTALILAEMFVNLSGYILNEGNQEVVDIIVDVASGKTSFEELAEWFKNRLIKA